MSRRLAETWLLAVLILGISVDVGVLCYSYWRHSLTVDPVPLRRLDSAGGVELRALSGAGQPVFAGLGTVGVRYVSRLCGFCERDVEGNRLAAELTRLQIPVVLLAPRESEVMQTPPEFVQAATFVSVGWSSRLRLTGTPVFMLLDSAGEILWHREGVLSSRDVDVALGAVDASFSRGR